MITEFDREGIAEYYRDKFGRCIADDDYESAFDPLFKYVEEKGDDELHLVLGMLYLQMTLDSDDDELIALSFRESMMQIVRDPKCERAYRNALAALALRRDFATVMVFCDWIKDKVDVKKCLGQLADAGALYISQEADPPDYDFLFEPGEYGKIDPEYYFDVNCALAALSDGLLLYSPTPEEECERIRKFPEFAFLPEAEKRLDAAYRRCVEHQKSTKSKIIEFAGVKSPIVAKPHPKRAKGDVISMDRQSPFSGLMDELGSLIHDDRDDEFYDDDQEEPDSSADYNAALGDFLNAYLYGDEEDEKDVEALMNAFGITEAHEATEKHRGTVKDSRVIIREAEFEADKGNLENALSILLAIDKNDPQYYFSLTMRAIIEDARGKTEAAESLVDEALKVKPGGALAGTLLCHIYASTDRGERIPETLKRIDVTDYVNTFHVYKAFGYALEYCKPDDALDLIESYIDEFNILKMRVVYAQMLYNRGDREDAIRELATLSKILYDDLSVQYFYRVAKSEIAPEFGLTAEASQGMIGVIVESFMENVAEGRPPKETSIDVDLEFFLTLEFRNSKKTLLQMFDTVRKLASDEAYELKMKEALVSPFVEDIVKALILSRLMARHGGDETFVYATGFRPGTAGAEFCGRTYPEYMTTAYAVMACLDRRNIPELFAAYERTKFPKETTERAKSYYLVNAASYGKLIKAEDRIPYLLGYTAKSAAAADLKAVDKK